MDLQYITAVGVVVVLATLIAVLIVRTVSIIFVGRRGHKIDVINRSSKQPQTPAESYPVHYSSEQHFNSTFRFVPWEASGLLVIEDQELIFEGKKRNGEALDVRFFKNDVMITYVPKSLIRDGGLSWFMIRTDEGRHYFTCKGALPDFSAPLTTTGLYEAVTDTYVRVKIPANLGSKLTQ